MAFVGSATNFPFRCVEGLINRFQCISSSSSVCEFLMFPKDRKDKLKTLFGFHSYSMKKVLTAVLSKGDIKAKLISVSTFCADTDVVIDCNREEVQSREKCIFVNSNLDHLISEMIEEISEAENEPINQKYPDRTKRSVLKLYLKVTFLGERV